MCDLKNGNIKRDKEFYRVLSLSKRFFSNNFGYDGVDHYPDIEINEVKKLKENFIEVKLNHKINKSQIGTYRHLYNV